MGQAREGGERGGKGEAKINDGGEITTSEEPFSFMLSSQTKHTIQQPPLFHFSISAHTEQVYLLEKYLTTASLSPRYKSPQTRREAPALRLSLKSQTSTSCLKGRP
jgi:hypothetical protein